MKFSPRDQFRVEEIQTSQLSELAETVTLVDGSFDPLHDGHIEYLTEAKKLGLPVLCNLPPDAITSLKHPVLVPRSSRAQVISSLRQVDYIHCGEVSTADVLALLRPRYFAKGVDWLLRGGLPEQEVLVCERLAIEIVYLETVTNSSSALLKIFSERLSSQSPIQTSFAESPPPTLQW